MTATWTRLADGERIECASASHPRPVSAEWRMDAGENGSYYCETCRYMITRGPRFGGKTTPITVTPTLKE